MSDDTTIDVFVPAGPCEKCARENLLRNPDTGQVRVYCSHHETGGTWNEKLQRWSMVGPIKQGEFEAWVRERATIKQGMKNMAAGIVPGNDADSLH